MSGLILVVEDDEKTLKLLRDILLAFSYKVIEATDGKQAVKQAIEGKPDLITMDMQLPGISGIDATRMIKSNPGTRHIPIIAITADAMKGQDRVVIEAGCDAHVSKPFDIDKLIEKISSFLPDD